MAWLARLDARADTWSRPIRWPYRGLKYLLVTLGVYLAIGSAYLEVTDGRLGIGLGICTVLLMASVAGLLEAVSGHTPASSPGPSRRPPTVP